MCLTSSSFLVFNTDKSCGCNLETKVYTTHRIHKQKGRHFLAGVPKLTNEMATVVTVVASVFNIAKHVCLFAEEADGFCGVAGMLAQNNNRRFDKGRWYKCTVFACIRVFDMRESKNLGQACCTTVCCLVGSP